MSPQIELGEWMPDMPKVGLAPGLLTCQNVTPRESGYGPFPSFVGLGLGSLTSYCRGAATGIKMDGTDYLIAGDSTDLYASVAGDLTSIGGGFTPTASSGWSFAQYGARVIACDYDNATQSWDFSTLTALSADASKARYCAVVRKFVVLGNIVGSGASSGVIGTLPEGIHWSAYDNAGSWPQVQTAPARAVQSDFQPLRGSGGAVQGILGGLDYGVVFQEHAVTRLEYVGGDIGFQTYPQERGRGAMIPGSIVGHGSLGFYAAEDGFFMFDGRESVPIGFGKIDRTVYSDLDQAQLARWSASILPESGIVAWMYPGSGSSGGTPNRLLLYNYKAQKWSLVQFTGEQLVRSVQSGFVLDNVGSNLDDVNANLDTYGPAAKPTTLAAFNSSHTLGTFSGTSMSATIETGDAELVPGSVSTVHGVRPVFDKMAGSALLLAARIGGRMRPGDDPEYGAYSVPNDVGICPQRKSGRYHRTTLTTLGDFDRLYGLDVKITSHGAR